MSSSRPATPTARVDPIIGIDLGTTNSVIAVADAAGPRILVGADGDDLVPSVVRYGDDGVEVVGREAAASLRDHPERTAYSIKRFMGRSLADRLPEARAMSYPVVEGPRGLAAIGIGDRPRTPQEVSAALLGHLRARAEEALDQPVRRAVVTVPAYFDDAQRQATRDAGRLAGLDVVRILNEPTAAALAYGIGEGRSPETIAVYDLGGGTFDITILEVLPPEGDEEEAIFRVLSTAGDSRLGGDDFDRLLVTDLLSEVGEADLDSPTAARRRALLREVGERAKIALGESDATRLLVDGGGILPDVDRVLERTDFERRARPLIDR
ncbi:MAG: Hsp70 family protein, partial [Planctomycetota bacterium]|nr:Hsp70 family protein [Planctomycetota bacterium]